MSNQISFQSWLDLCITQDDKSNVDASSQEGSDEIALRLRREARLHFEALSSASPSESEAVVGPAPPPSPSNASTVAEDISKASSATPNGALALLVSSLGPAFLSSATADAKVRALFCLMGAIEGSDNLTHGVRQAVGRFLVELCRPESREHESDAEEESGDDEMDYVDAANLTSEEVTQQLEAMAQRKNSSAKRSRKNTSSLTHDDVRDAAMTGLTALIRSQLEIFPTQQSQSLESKKSLCPVTKAMGVVHQSMELRVELAMLGVRYRCQTDESNTSNGDEGMWGGAGAGYETIDAGLNIEDGLSQLPRLKRSLCFNLLEGALDGLNEDGLKWNSLQAQPSSSNERHCALPSSLLTIMSTFGRLTSSCMHGETDPRCLLQLMRLLNKMQRVMLPLFSPKRNTSSEGVDQMDVESTGVMFPSIEIFDAVAPYYPVQFTPPKNDPHGITRKMLQEALMAVLCERGAFYNSQSMLKKNSGDDEEEKETMIVLAARMFLERLEPPKSSDYAPPSDGSESEVEDKLDAARDLSNLLLPQTPPSKNGAMADTNSEVSELQYSLNATRVTSAFLSELSSSMARVHEEAVSSDTKQLASVVRKFSSSLAHTLEPAASSKSTGVNTTPLWEAYVVDILRHLTPTLGSSPQGLHGRASTAYFASLAAEGGLMTLNKVLDGCYPRFLGVLSLLDEHGKAKEVENSPSPSKSQTSKQKSRDEEKLAAAMRGIAALVSSCRVALQKWQRDNSGVQVHPHPLSPYVSATIQKIAIVLKESLNEDEVGPLSLAAAGALESITTSADLSALEEEDMISLEKSFSLISRAVLSEEGREENDSANLPEWKTACARALGAVISVGLCQKKNSHDAMTTFQKLATSLLPEILASATSPPRDSPSGKIRYDWIVIAGACANGTCHVSEQIVSELLSSIIAALSSNRTDQRAPAMALSYIVRHGGPDVGTAFHTISPPGPTPFDIIQELCKPLQTRPDDVSMDIEDKRKALQLQVGMSSLQLPMSRAQDEEVANDTIERAHSILPLLIPAYECSSSGSSRGDLVQFVDQVLPPLSEWDEVKLCVAFPLLAAVLNSQVWETLDSAIMESLRSMITYLAEFSISSDHNAHSRSAAASCLFSILFHGSQDDECDGNADIIKKLLEEVVSPALTDALACLKRESRDSITPRASGSVVETPKESLHSAFSRVEDTLSFLGVLGSAAACKGGPFSQTSDRVASFLIELACTGTSQFFFSEITMQLETPTEQGKNHPLLHASSHAYILPATSFGSMLTVHNGGPFWRQRMTHKTLPVLLKALQVQAKSQDPPALGTLAVVCHMLCCLPESILGKSNIQQILPTLIAGLVYFSKNLNVLAQSEMISSKPTDILSIILAALIKILAVSPGDVTKFIGIIIPSLLLLSSPTVSSETYIPKQLLVFQCLETVAGHPQARNSILREKDQVVAVLSGAVDHPSLLIRNALVQTRNVWYTLA